MCGTAFSGAGGFLLGLTGVKRSNRNPNVCNRCNTHIQDGKLTEVTILFVDLCSFTAMIHKLGPEKTHEVVDSFLTEATKIIVSHDGSVDKYIGDCAMALFNIPIHHDDHAARAIAAARDLISLMPKLSEKHGRKLRIRAGVATGAVRVGHLGSADSRDYTALGDAVNRAARLQSKAKPGEIVADIDAFQQVVLSYPNAIHEEMKLKGFPSPVIGFRLKVDPTAMAEDAPSAPEEGPVRSFGKRGWAGIRSFLIALLGAPCLLGAALNPATLFVALGSVAGSSAQALTPSHGIDHWAIRIPLTLLVLIGVGINLYLVLNARKMRKELSALGTPLDLTPKEKSRERWVLGMSVAAIVVLILEALAHRFVMHHPMF